MKNIFLIGAILIIAFSFSSCYTPRYVEVRGTPKYRGQSYSQPYRYSTPYSSHGGYSHGRSYYGSRRMHH